MNCWPCSRLFTQVPLTVTHSPALILGGMTHHRHQVSMTAGLDAQHAEAVLGVVERDALDRSRQHLGGLRAGLGLI
ncbi:hypothetical protein [Synechococcus sp. SynAce01]|uniref:hypothetical protein n=1 Tax=Synechococcus sp. SynAce01 TaxID=1916956 RepID=UPI001F26B860|nr:hypothetical protein [Synechococcus sp. SynAce01]